ncbi:hypothetical protein PFISCL1PPCAC_23065, partial [Pristionchus fissidentatus]
QAVMGEIDKIMEETPKKAYDDLKKMYSNGGSNEFEVLWRLAQACQTMARVYDRKNAKRKDLILEGRGYAQAAAAIDETRFTVLKWAAILTGASTDYVGMKERIEQGYKFKKYLDAALAIDAREFSLLHMRGRYAYEVANLSWFERKIATTFFAAPPEATIDEALRDFLAANEARGKWIENILYVARCYIAKNDSNNAVIFLNKTLSISPTNDSERELIEDAKGLIRKHSG